MFAPSTPGRCTDWPDHLGRSSIAKPAAKSTNIANEAGDLAAAKAEAMYQFKICTGLAVASGLIGTASALMMHNAI